MDATILEALTAALDAMPLFPLPEVVLFPHGLLPLHVFEPRYRALVKDCLASYRVFAVPQIMTGDDVDEHGHPPIAAVAGVGVILEHYELPDGRSTLLLQGQARVRLDELDFEPPYRRARATLLLDDGGEEIPSADRAALVATADAFAQDVRKQEPRFTFRAPSGLLPGAMADVYAHHLLFDPLLRQSLLDELDPLARVRAVTTEIARQHAALHRAQGGVLH